MRLPLLVVLAGSILVASSSCAELEGLVASGEAEGRVLWQRLNAWIEEGDQADAPGKPGDPDAVRVNDPRYSGGAAPATGGPAPAPPSVERERFLASYALLACSQAATTDPVERERRRTELFRVLGYTNFSWLDDMQRFGTGDGDLLKALCRP